MDDPSPELQQACIDTVRTLAADAVQQANSGHPGTPIALAPAAFVLWTKHLRYDSAHPDWPDRDRFVLSCGHASMLLYSMLHLTGYDLSLDDLKAFRQWDSRTPGHPERLHAPGIETTTGPLGQGMANAVGMAIAEELLAHEFNTSPDAIVDHRTFVFASDGDLMEGISHEAASLAGHLQLGKLIVLYDDNHITIDGETELTFTDDRSERFRAYGWHVQKVEDGNDLEALDEAFTAAEQETSKPSIIVCRTHIGYGLPTKQDSPSAHGEALGEDEIRAWKEQIGWPAEAFVVPNEVAAFLGEAGRQGSALREAWEARLAEWSAAEPAKAKEWDRRMAGRMPAGLADVLPSFSEEKIATRKAQVKILAALAPEVPELVGGSADLTPSNGTTLGDVEAFEPGKPGRYIHYGVREHGMAGAMNGMAVHGGLRPYGGTFLIFSDYHKNSVRLAALMGASTIFVYSHDSVGLGEDGPTHQPIEQLAGLRAIPNLPVFRPGDANETAQAWRLALERNDGPSVIIVTRQDLPVLDQTVYAPAAQGVERGAYILIDHGTGNADPEVIFIATGSEVQLAVGAAKELASEGTTARVVSMPCWELFQAQDQAYRDEVLPPSVKARVGIEAAASLGWERWVGDEGLLLTIDHFGASAPGARAMEEFGFTVEHALELARSLID